MQFPFTITIHQPRPVAWSLGLLAATLGVTALVLVWTRPWVARDQVPGAVVSVRSVPSAARVTVDGQDRGHTPLELALAPGAHQIRVQQTDYVPMSYALQLARGVRRHLRAVLWRAHPIVVPLRSPLPGAHILAAGFLGDGRVTLTLGLPSGDERQLWVVDQDGIPRRIGPPTSFGAIASACDGNTVAYLQPSANRLGGPVRLDQLWISRRPGDPGQRQDVRTAPNERLVDLSWAPDGQRLLVASAEQLPTGGSETRLRLVTPADGRVRDLLRLPSALIPSSETWSPTGDEVAFLVKTADHVVLCLLDLGDGTLRSLANLNAGAAAPFAPLAWSADGTRLLYSAPVQDAPTLGGWLFGARSQRSLFVVDSRHPLGHPLGSAKGAFPAWRDDGSILALSQRSRGGSLTLRLIDPDGQSHDPSASSGQALSALPLPASADVAVRWDVAHGQALVAIPDPGGPGATHLRYWRVRFPEGGGQ